MVLKDGCVCGCALESGLLCYRFEGHGEGHANACEIEHIPHDFVRGVSRLRGRITDQVMMRFTLANSALVICGLVALGRSGPL